VGLQRPWCHPPVQARRVESPPGRPIACSVNAGISVAETWRDSTSTSSTDLPACSSWMASIPSALICSSSISSKWAGRSECILTVPCSISIASPQLPSRSTASWRLTDATSHLDASSKVTMCIRGGLRLNPLSHTFKHERRWEGAWAECTLVSRQ